MRATGAAGKWQRRGRIALGAQQQVRGDGGISATDAEGLGRLGVRKAEGAQAGDVLIANGGLLAPVPIVDVVVVLGRPLALHVARHVLPRQPQASALDLRVGLEHEDEAQAPALRGCCDGHAVLLRAEQDRVPVLHEHAGVVDVQDSRGAQAHQDGPNVMAMVGHLRHAIRVPIHLDRVPRRVAVLRRRVGQVEVVHDPHH
mmetsp:Transcript_12558/g.36056  ORF Transcript_12558/g.36056 Transcript_12558/m.36056 type:complete len:201 (+) Transcript_12558:2-604(+)